MTVDDREARVAEYVLGTLDPADRAALERELPADPALRERMAKPARNLIPARADLPPSEVIDLFQSMAEGVFATVDRVADMREVPEVLSEYLKRENLPAQVVMAPDPSLDQAPWDSQPLLEIRRGLPVESDMVSVTSAPAAIAETGTLAMFSGADHPSTLNFLPETHVVVLPVNRIGKNYEDVWDLIRQRIADGEGDLNGLMPRTVNLIPARVASSGIAGIVQQLLILSEFSHNRAELL